MPTAQKTRALLTLALLLAAGAARAQVPAFVHAATVYEDEKNKPLRTPEGVACADGGTVVVADTGNGRLLRLAYRNGQLSGGAEQRVAELPYPVRVQLDKKGNALVLDRKVRKIGRVDPSGKFLGWLEVKGIPAPGDVVPGAFKVDGNDNVYLLDVAAGKVLVVDPTGAVTRQLDVPKRPAFVTDIAVDSGGTVYALDAAGGQVWSAPRSATTFTVLAKGLRDWMSFPGYVATTRGRLFIVDQNGGGLVVLGNDGSYQGRQLGIGWSDGFVYYPAQLCIDEQGEAFLADRYNNRLQVFTLAK